MKQFEGYQPQRQSFDLNDALIRVLKANTATLQQVVAICSEILMIRENNNLPVEGGRTRKGTNNPFADWQDIVKLQEAFSWVRDEIDGTQTFEHIILKLATDPEFARDHLLQQSPSPSGDKSAA